MQRVALLNGKNINQDFDLSKIFESLAEKGVFEGLEVRNNEVTKGYAFIEVQRNSKNFYVLFENSENFQIDTSGNKKVFIEINQENIDYGINNNENGTEIGSIKIAPNYPTKNFLPLASITNGQITDERVWVTLRDDLIGRKIYKKNEVYSKNEADSRFVNISGDEEIAGKKRFSDLTNFEGGIAVSNRTDDFTGVLNSPNAIALGDNDTGFLSPAEGQIEAYTNGMKVFKTQDDWIEFNKQVTTTQTTPLWDHSLVTKGYVGLEIDKRITKAINKANSRNARIDIWLFS